MHEEYPANGVPNGHENPYQSANPNSSLFFTDGVRSIDFVLVWRNEEISNNLKDERDSKRQIFETNLVSEGLEIESEIVEEEFHFVKVTES